MKKRSYSWLLWVAPFLVLAIVPFRNWVQTRGAQRALFIALETRDLPALEKSLDAGAPLDAAGKNNERPLEFAITHFDTRGGVFLIRRGADVHFRSSTGLSPIQLALRDGGETALLDALEKAGASSDPVSDLMIAVVRSDLQETKRLVRVGVRVDALNANRDGWTSLMWAAAHGDLPMVQLLLNLGADPTLRDNYNNYGTAQNIARTFNRVPPIPPPARKPDYQKTIQLLQHAERKRQGSKSTVL